MNRDLLADPPLPSGELVRTWTACIDAWASGRRRDALGLADALVSGLDNLQREQRDLFAVWLCEGLFDEGRGWLGQFGGGLAYDDGAFSRPVEYALSINPFSTRVVVPYLSAASPERHGHALRWLYQALIGLAYRVPPDSRAELEATMRSICGPDADPLDVLREAAVEDEFARQWLEELDSELKPGR